MDFSGKQLHFVVTPAAGNAQATVFVETDGPVDGFIIDYTAFLFAGDRGPLAAVEFIAQVAPARVRPLVMAALAANQPIRLDRTVVPRTDVERAFGFEAPDAKCA